MARSGRSCRASNGRARKALSLALARHQHALVGQSAPRPPHQPHPGRHPRQAPFCHVTHTGESIAHDILPRRDVRQGHHPVVFTSLGRSRSCHTECGVLVLFALAEDAKPGDLERFGPTRHASQPDRTSKPTKAPDAQALPGRLRSRGLAAEWSLPDKHVPRSSVEILGHSVGGITYRQYPHRAPLAFRAIKPLPQPTAFSALLNGCNRECPCCHRRFADAA